MNNEIDLPFLRFAWYVVMSFAIAWILYLSYGVYHLINDTYWGCAIIWLGVILFISFLGAVITAFIIGFIFLVMEGVINE